MGSKREEVKNQRADELCKALVRMPLMTYKQISKILSIAPIQATRIIKDFRDRFTEHTYRENYISPRYTIGSGYMKTVIGLSKSAFDEWSKKEGLQSRRIVRAKDIDRVLSVTDILVQLRLKQVLYDKWDLMLPQQGNEGLHGWFKRVSDGRQLGLYLLPTRYDKESKHKSIYFMQRGIILRVTQHIQIKKTLFLVPADQYELTLKIMMKDNVEGVSLFLLPLETFLANPDMHLNAIIDGDVQAFSNIERHMRLNDRYFVPAHYAYRALARVAPDTYRFVDAYTNGSIERVRSWSEESNKLAYLVPNTGAAATAWVYAYDKDLEDGLRAVLEHERSIVEVNPWPITTMSPLVDEDDGDWSMFDGWWGNDESEGL